MHSAVCTVTCPGMLLFKTLCKPNKTSLSYSLSPSVWITSVYYINFNFFVMSCMVFPDVDFITYLTWSQLLSPCTLCMSNPELLVVPWTGHVLLRLMFLLMLCSLHGMPFFFSIPWQNLAHIWQYSSKLVNFPQINIVLPLLRHIC